MVSRNIASNSVILAGYQEKPLPQGVGMLLKFYQLSFQPARFISSFITVIRPVLLPRPSIQLSYILFQWRFSVFFTLVCAPSFGPLATLFFYDTIPDLFYVESAWVVESTIGTTLTIIYTLSASSVLETLSDLCHRINHP